GPSQLAGEWKSANLSHPSGSARGSPTPSVSRQGIWQLLPDNRSREAVEVAERYADSRATDEELESASYAADVVWEADMERAAREGKWDRDSPLPYYSASAAAYNVAIPLGWWGAAPAFVSMSRAKSSNDRLSRSTR